MKTISPLITFDCCKFTSFPPEQQLWYDKSSIWQEGSKLCKLSLNYTQTHACKVHISKETAYFAIHKWFADFWLAFTFSTQYTAKNSLKVHILFWITHPTRYSRVHYPKEILAPFKLLFFLEHFLTWCLSLAALLALLAALLQQVEGKALLLHHLNNAPSHFEAF